MGGMVQLDVMCAGDKIYKILPYTPAVRSNSVLCNNFV